MSHTAYPYPIDVRMYAEQRERLGKSLLGAFPGKDHAALVQGSSEVPINSTDCNYLFWQESYFTYLFGYDVPDVYGAVFADGTGVLFIPRLPDSYETWMGPLPTPEGVQQITGVSEVYFVDEMERVLQEKGIVTVEVMSGVNSDSNLPVLEPRLPSGCSLLSSNHWLYHVLTTQRCFKTELEAGVLQYVCKASSEAHVHVMQKCQPGQSQHQLEANFLHHVYHNGGCRKVSYTCICATGHHGAILHYPNNDAPVLDGSMALLDMGGNYRGYAADITCSFPVNGRFTADQKMIYLAVLDAHDQVLRAVKPGVSWVDLHKLALRVMCEHLIRGGILIGDVETLMEKQIMRLFQPHGLGHLLGLDVHDVGGYLGNCPDRPTEADCCKLRTARVLEQGLYITVEPGCYFNHKLLSTALADPEVKPYLNETAIQHFWNFGGVRIESDVLVTADGVANYTVVPRTIEEIERTMAGHPFSKQVEVFHNA